MIPPRGRGSASNPDQRFASLHLSYDDGEQARPGGHQLFRDHSKTVISRNDSPDLSFEASLNPYRGCEHGCAYCYARPTHEYLGFSAGYDFDSKIMVKEDAPALLRAEFAHPRYQPVKLSCSGVTDPYQPIEKKLQLTRRCLEVLVECRHPVVFITKNHLITRDLDLLRELAQHQAVAVYISVTTLELGLGPQAGAPRQLPHAAARCYPTVARRGHPRGRVHGSRSSPRSMTRKSPPSCKPPPPPEPSSSAAPSCASRIA